MNIVINFLVLLSVARADLNLSLKETLLEKNKIPFEEGNIFWRRIVEGSFSFSKPTSKCNYKKFVKIDTSNHFL